MAPGVYAEFSEHSGTPQGFVFGAGWAVVEAIRADNRRRSSARHRRPPSAAHEYTRAFEEVRTVGRFKSRARTADQTHLAYVVEGIRRELAQPPRAQLVLDEQPDLWTSARAVRACSM